MSQDKPLKWHSMDELAAQQLVNATQSPGVVFPVELPMSAAPSQFQAIRGVVSYFASNFLNPVVSSNGLTIGGEVVLARTDAELVKNYNYMFATSTDAKVHFCGPFKNFDAHHFQSSTPVPVETLFGHSPAGKSRAP
jgi:hypothetical protein